MENSTLLLRHIDREILTEVPLLADHNKGIKYIMSGAYNLGQLEGQLLLP